MSVYKALAAATLLRGSVELPDGNTYPVTALSMGELLTMERLQEADAPDAESLPVLIGIAARVTGADVAVIELLAPDALGHLLMMAKLGVDAVVAALTAEAPASGNGRAPSAAPTPRRSTSRSKR